MYTLRYIALALTLLIFVVGCSSTSSLTTLNQLKSEIESLQQNSRVSGYASPELRDAEKSLILAINAWNKDDTATAEKHATVAKDQITLAWKVAKEAESLGLSPKEWEQRRFLQDYRQRLLTNH